MGDGGGGDGMSDHSMRLKRRIVLSDSESPSPASTPKRIKIDNDLHHIPPTVRHLFPKSAYDHSPPVDICSEERLLEDFSSWRLCLSRSLQTEVSDCLPLDNFEIYRPPSAVLKNTLAALDELLLKWDRFFLFDGIVRLEGKAYSLRGLQFETVSIEGYGSPDSTDMVVYLQTSLTKRYGFWYKLKQPSATYARFHGPFLWATSFTKYFVDYVNNDEIRLAHFRRNFAQWLDSQYSDHADYRSWRGQHPSPDFRQAVIANAEFLWKESIDVCPDLRTHEIWREIDPDHENAIIPSRRIKQDRTVATDYASMCFQGMYFDDMIEVRKLPKEVERQMFKRAATMGISNNPPRYPVDIDVEAFDKELLISREVKAGDSVAVIRDHESVWKDSSALWFAYVQRVSYDHHERPYYQVIWLYRPSETSCGDGLYPFCNELFFSDHCNCDAGRIRRDHIKGVLPVSLFTNPLHTTNHVAIRQIFKTPDVDDGLEARFKTLKASHLLCGHLCTRRHQDRVYEVGTTILYREKTGKLLEPAIFMGSVQERAILRRLSRLHLRDSEASRHELLLHNDEFSIPLERVVRQCQVRRFKAEAVRAGSIPGPYAYDGCGDFWCHTMKMSFDSIEPIILTGSASFLEGYDPAHKQIVRPLAGLSLFTGGGSFDRGLEEGGGVRFKYAVEMASPAVHTYRANLESPEDCHIYRGSVNDYLLTKPKNNDGTVAKVGDIDFISAGSPCQGFTNANQNRNSVESKNNASLVSTNVSFLSVYTPMYAIFENVLGMCTGLGPRKTDNVYSQMVCAIVGMGYQLETAMADSWMNGGCSTRSRLLLLVSAPGLKPLRAPLPSHSSPARVNGRCVGRLANGVEYGVRRLLHYTPHRFVSSADALGDLPQIGDGFPYCVKYPDHRVAQRASGIKMATPFFIPRESKASKPANLVQAIAQGTLPGEMKEYWSKRSGEITKDCSKAYQRVRADELLPTIRTSCKPDDSRLGVCLHYDEPRQLTLMEVRRAQSIPDHEVLVGKIHEQWKIVGNGVDRRTATAFGTSLMKAWHDPRSRIYLKQRLLLETENRVKELRKPRVIVSRRSQSIETKQHMRGDQITCANYGIRETEEDGEKVYHIAHNYRADSEDLEGLSYKVTAIPVSRTTEEKTRSAKGMSHVQVALRGVNLANPIVIADD